MRFFEIYQSKLFEKIKDTNRYAVVYHRTRTEENVKKITEQGFIPGGGAAYGKGLYTTYSLDSQMNERMVELYGRYLIKGYILTDGLIYIDKNASTKPLKQQLEDYEIYNVFMNYIDSWDNEEIKYGSDIAKMLHQKLEKHPKINGVVFEGRADGFVAVLYNPKNFVPIAYTEVGIDKENINWTQIDKELVSKNIKSREDKESSEQYISMIKKLLKRNVEPAEGFVDKALVKIFSKDDSYEIDDILDLIENNKIFNNYKPSKKVLQAAVKSENLEYIEKNLEDSNPPKNKFVDLFIRDLDEEDYLIILKHYPIYSRAYANVFGKNISQEKFAEVIENSESNRTSLFLTFFEELESSGKTKKASLENNDFEISPELIEALLTSIDDIRTIVEYIIEHNGNLSEKTQMIAAIKDPEEFLIFALENNVEISDDVLKKTIKDNRSILSEIFDFVEKEKIPKKIVHMGMIYHPRTMIEIASKEGFQIPEEFEKAAIDKHGAEEIYSAMVLKKYPPHDGLIEDFILNSKESYIYLIEFNDLGILDRADELFKLYKEKWGDPERDDLNERYTLNDLNPDKAYELFTKSYQQSTGSAWDKNKFLSRARGWAFYGDENGYVAVRPQRSGMKKLVSVAGSPKSIMKGLQELKQEGGPIWGAVSNDLVPMSEKVGFIAPHKKVGGAFLIKNLIKMIPSSVFGGYTPTVNKDGGFTIDYEDVGSATKYIIGNKEYFKSITNNPQFKNWLKDNPMYKKTLGLLNLSESLELLEAKKSFKKIKGTAVFPVYFCEDADDFKFLIGQRSNKIKDGGKWDFLGGGRDNMKEPPEVSACREAWEEGGIKVSEKTLIPAATLENDTGYYKVFLHQTKNPLKFKANENEVQNIGYFTIPEIKKMELHNRIKDTLRSSQFKVLIKSLYILKDRGDKI